MTPPLWRSPAAYGLAGLTIIGLMIALVLVVQGISQRGAQRRYAEAEQARNRWLCASLARPLARDNCRIQLASAQR